MKELLLKQIDYWLTIAKYNGIKSVSDSNTQHDSSFLDAIRRAEYLISQYETLLNSKQL